VDTNADPKRTVARAPAFTMRDVWRDMVAPLVDGRSRPSLSQASAATMVFLREEPAAREQV
jgi:hypothetical protein